MANPDKARGFIFAQTLDGSAAVGMLRKLTVAARSDATGNHGDIYIGDPVKMSNLGVVAVANSGDIVYGVCVGAGEDNIDHGPTGMYTPDNLERRYLPNATAGFIWVIPKENALFEIQSASDLDYTVGRSCDHTVTAATAHGSQTTSFSTAELTTEANGDVTIVTIVDTPDNDSTLTNTRYLVTIN